MRSVDVAQQAWVIRPAGDGQPRLLDRSAGSSTAPRRRIAAARPAARRGRGRTPASDHGAARPGRRPTPPVDGGDPPRHRRQRGCRRTSTTRRSCDQCAPVRAARIDIAVWRWVDARPWKGWTGDRRRTERDASRGDLQLDGVALKCAISPRVRAFIGTGLVSDARTAESAHQRRSAAGRTRTSAPESS